MQRMYRQHMKNGWMNIPEWWCHACTWVLCRETSVWVIVMDSHYWCAHLENTHTGTCVNVIETTDVQHPTYKSVWAFKLENTITDMEPMVLSEFINREWKERSTWLNLIITFGYMTEALSKFSQFWTVLESWIAIAELGKSGGRTSGIYW